RRLVPGPYPGCPALLEVSLADHLSEGENAVVAVQPVLGHAGALGYRAVMCVVKEQSIAAVQGPVPTYRLDQLMVVPLVNQDQVCVVQCVVEIEGMKIELAAGKTGVGLAKSGNRLR